MLITNFSLKSINIYGNYIEDEGGIEIAEALKTNCILSWIDLSNNKIVNAEAKIISETITLILLSPN